VKFSIENASRTRIVLADTYVIITSRIEIQLINRNVHILGSVQNIKIARDAVVSLILGSPPGMSSMDQSQNEADVSRKGLRSLEVCWSKAQAAILGHCSGYRFGVYVLIFHFSACSNDYLYAISFSSFVTLSELNASKHMTGLSQCILCDTVLATCTHACIAIGSSAVLHMHHQLILMCHKFSNPVIDAPID